jgi:transcriptional regulator with XRE-family HTH domain
MSLFHTPEFSPERFHELRMQQDLTVPDLAARSGLSQAQIYRMERGERPRVAAVTLARIALALGTSVEYLVGVVDDMRPVMRPAREEAG